MKSKASSSSQPRIRGIVYKHYETNKRGKTVSVKRPRVDAASSSKTVPLSNNAGNRPGSHNPHPPYPTSIDDGGIWEDEVIPPVFRDTDDLGPGDTPEFPSKSSPNRHLRDWEDRHSSSYLQALFHRLTAPMGITCVACFQSSPDLYRCKTCLWCIPSCSKCLLQSHQHHPTHAISRWNGSFWEDSTWSALGLVMHLGHGGKPCELGGRVTQLLVGDITGFYELPVSFCRHSDAKSKGVQLLEFGLFPCSDINPESAFTLTCLEHFGVFASLGKTSGHKYYSVLERLTKTGFPGKVHDRYRELMLTYRKYAHLTNLKRSGLAFPAHPKKAWEDSLAIRCISCPNKGVYFFWCEVRDEEKVYFVFWFSYDGNSRNPRKDKKVDIGDISFTDGKMYYVLQKPYKEWVDADGSGPDYQTSEHPECDNHKAAAEKHVRWGGLEVTGVGACTCARHSFFLPHGLVDYFKGERFVYTDYAVGSVINSLIRNGSLAFGMTYDIWCHWIPNLMRRASHFPPHIALPADLQLTGGVPKFHLQGHIENCMVRYSLNNTPYVGRMEGEGCERAWAYLNETSGSTSEKSPGARWDSINYIVGDWNFDKMIRMGSFLASKFFDAKKMYPKQLDIFTELDESLPTTMTDEWRALSIEPTLGPKGKWTSPFTSSEWSGSTFQEVIQEERKEEQDGSQDPSRKVGVTKWLSSAIELESSMEKLRKDEAALGSGTPGKHNLLNDRRLALQARLLEHRTHLNVYMSHALKPNHPDRPFPLPSDPERAELGLPSSYLFSSLVAASCRKLAEQEAKLRRAVCNDSLQSIKNMLGAKALALKHKRKNLRGYGPSTRAESALRDQNEKVARAQWRYNNSRDALFRLNPSESDRTTYQELKKEDLKLLTSYLDDESKGLGQGYRAIPWLWRTKVAENNEEWQIEALKVEWFRARQRYLQWEEELKLVKREMVMAARDFQTRQQVWDFKSRASNLTPGMKEYAAQKSNFFARLGHLLTEKCDECVTDPIVELKWAKEHWPVTFTIDATLHANNSGNPDRTSLDTLAMADTFYTLSARDRAKPWVGFEKEAFGSMSGDSEEESENTSELRDKSSGTRDIVDGDGAGLRGMDRGKGEAAATVPKRPATKQLGRLGWKAGRPPTKLKILDRGKEAGKAVLFRLDRPVPGSSSDAAGPSHRFDSPVTSPGPSPASSPLSTKTESGQKRKTLVSVEIPTTEKKKRKLVHPQQGVN